MSHETLSGILLRCLYIYIAQSGGVASEISKVIQLTISPETSCGYSLKFNDELLPKFLTENLQRLLLHFMDSFRTSARNIPTRIYFEIALVIPSEIPPGMQGLFPNILLKMFKK